jgi:hypothetical protein
MASNGTKANDIAPPRYIMQWVTEHDKAKSGAAQLKVIGYCVRDRGTPEWTTIFEHEDKVVCEKLVEILNEGT